MKPDPVTMKPDSELDPDEQVVDQFMQGSLRVRHLDDLCDALRTRIRAFRDEIQRTPEGPDRARLESRLQDARKQLGILRQERAISEFVEDSVRVTLHNESHTAEDEEDE